MAKMPTWMVRRHWQAWGIRQALGVINRAIRFDEVIRFGGANGASIPTDEIEQQELRTVAASQVSL
jgi:hypothetical protein